jgi:hypothetical protein
MPPWHSGAGDKAWVFVDEIFLITRFLTEATQGLNPVPGGVLRCDEVRLNS